MEYHLQKINNIKIKPIVGRGKNEIIKGHELFSYKYPSVHIIGASGSGKTSLMANIIPFISSKNTNLILMSLTAEEDPIIKKLAERYEIFMLIMLKKSAIYYLILMKNP